MERGLLWLPLLIAFFWLAWAGWNEYQKIEAYQRWAAKFERAKYDIRSVLGQKGTQLTWGKPTRQEPTALQTISLEEIAAIDLWVNKETVDLENLPKKGDPAIALTTKANQQMTIPFTDITIALQWYQFLQKQLS